MKKRNLVLSCGLIGLAFATLGVANITSVQSAKADGTSFVMVDGASIRVAADEQYGIRYTADLGVTTEAALQSTYGADATFHVMIIPYSYIDTYDLDTDYYGELYEELSKTQAKPYIATMEAIPFVATAEDKGLTVGNYYVRGSLTSLQYGNLNRDFFGIAYYQTDANTRVYAAFNAGENVRDVVNVASKALNSGDYAADTDTTAVLNAFVKQGINASLYPNDESKKDESVDSLLDTISLPATVVVKNKAETTLTVNNLPANTDIAVLWSAEKDQSIVSVDENGKLTVTGYGEADVTATVLGKTYTCTVKSVQAVNDLGDVEVSDATALTIATGAIEGELTSVTVGETAIDLANVTYADGTVTIAKSALASVYGQQDVVIQIGESTVVTSGLFITDIVTSASELRAMQPKAEALSGGGYFVLGNDITDLGAKDITNHESYNYANACAVGKTDAVPFTGTFDGRGYCIDGLGLRTYSNGVFGFLNGATIKNVSFTNASDSNSGSDYTNAFLGRTKGSNPTFDNIYIHMMLQNGNIILGAANFGKIFVEIDAVGAKVKTPFTDGANHKSGVVVIGKTIDANKNGALAYESFAKLAQANVSFDAWDNDFWDLKNGYPYPANLALPTATATISGVPAQSDVNETITVETESRNTVAIDAAALENGLTINGNVITIPDNADLLGTSITVTVTNVYDPTVTASTTVQLISVKEITVADLGDVDLSNTATAVTINAGETIEGELASATIGDTAIDLSGVSYADGVITVAKSAILATVWGQKDITIVFNRKNGETVVGNTTVKTSALMITDIITNASELLGMAAQAQELSGGGYFVLGDNITDMSTGGDYNFANKNSVGTSTIPFAGTFDGRGYYIDGLRVQIYNSGVFGVCNGATIKNVAFINGADGTATDAKYLCSGTVKLLENVYIQMTTQNARVITASVETFRNIFIDVPEGSTSLVITDGTHDKSTVYVVGNTNGSSPKKYANRAALIAAAVDFNGWVGDFWALDNDELPIAKSVANK